MTASRGDRLWRPHHPKQLDVWSVSFSHHVHLMSNLNRIDTFISFVVRAVALTALIVFLRFFFGLQAQSTIDSPTATPGAPLNVTGMPSPNPTRTPPSAGDFYALQRLTSTPNGAYQPVIAPDGKHMAYASERTGNWDIYVLDWTTGVETRLTDDPLNDMAPSWSPDGTRIAYQHNVPSQTGPVKAEYTVMNADGSNKTVLRGDINWNGNLSAVWSPSNDRIAVNADQEVIIFQLSTQSEIRRFSSQGGGLYGSPVWLDNGRIEFSTTGGIWIGEIESGYTALVDTPPGPVVALLTPQPVAYVWFDGPLAKVNRFSATGSNPFTTAVLSLTTIEYAAMSPDGRFVAVASDTGIHVVNVATPVSQPGGPVFSIDTQLPPSDLHGVSWLPDSSGFVFTAGIDGQPDLYLARLNLTAIEYFGSAPTPIAPLIPTTEPERVPITVTNAAFVPDPSTPLNRNASFEFGGELTVQSSIGFVANVVAFDLAAGETPPSCTPQVTPTDRFSWSKQEYFPLGEYTLNTRFFYSDDYAGMPNADRLLVRLSVIAPGANSRVLYCADQTYQLIDFTPPTVTPSPIVTSTTEVVTITLFPAQSLGGSDYVVSGTVMVSAEAIHAVRVEFFTAPIGADILSHLEHIDTNASNGWTWQWTPPASGLMAHVWAEAVYADGSRLPSAYLLVASPDAINPPSPPQPSPTPIAMFTPTPIPCGYMLA